MRVLVSELKKRKTGATKQSSRPKRQVSSSKQSSTESGLAGDGSPAVVSPRQRGAQPATSPRQRGRYVSRAVRRAVWKRDGERCTYVDAMGQRCRETGGLELDHVDPHARGGPPTVANLRLRCRAHNALAAEHEFGRDFMAAHIGVGGGQRSTLSPPSHSATRVGASRAIRRDTERARGDDIRRIRRAMTKRKNATCLTGCWHRVAPRVRARLGLASVAGTAFAGQ